MAHRDHLVSVVDATSVKTLVLCGGNGKRWAGFKGAPKHLLRIEGERLLDRTVRQFAGFSEVEIVARPRTYGYHHPQALTVEARLDPNNFGADRFRSSRDRWDGLTILVYGDVWFSDEAVVRIADWAHHQTDWRWIARMDRSEVTGKRYGEGFGFILPPDTHQLFDAAVGEGIELCRAGVDDVVGWTVYRIMAGGDGFTHEDLGHLLSVDDWTEDFDWPRDYIDWMQRRLGNI